MVLLEPVIPHRLEEADVLVVLAVTKGRRSDLGLLRVGVESLDIARRHGSAQGRKGDGALLALGYCIGRRVLLLPLPKKILAETAREFGLEHVAACRLGRHGWRVDVGRGHDDGLGPAGLLTHHQPGLLLG